MQNDMWLVVLAVRNTSALPMIFFLPAFLYVVWLLRFKMWFDKKKKRWSEFLSCGLLKHFLAAFLCAHEGVGTST